MQTEMMEIKAQDTVTGLCVPVLKLGCEGDTVVALQLMLQGHTNPRLLANGYFGLETELEVKEYQARVGLAADGFVGPETWASLLGVTR